MRLFLCLLAILTWPLAVLAQNERAPEIPELQVEVVAATGAGGAVFVQQQVLVRITLVSRYPFKALRIDMPQIANAERHTASRPRTTRFSTYGGSGWRHQRVIALFPSRSGVLEIPPVRASGAVEHPDGRSVDFRDGSEARVLEVMPAHRYLDGFWWVAADSIALVEQWSADVATLRIGDTVRRTVTMQAEGVTADRLPELVQQITPGARIVALGEERRTRFTPGGASAEVTASWDITVETESPVNVPPVSVTWWNTAESRPASSGVPATRIEPLAIDGDKLRAELLAEAAARRDRGTLLLYLFAAVLLAPFLVLLGLLLHAAVPTLADIRLRRALQRGTGIDQARALVGWARATVAPGARTLGDIARVAPPAARTSLRSVEAAAFARSVHSGAEPGVFVRWSRARRLERIRQDLFHTVQWITGNNGHR